MAIRDITPIAERSSQWGARNDHSYTLRWLVRTTDPDDDGGVVLRATGIPKIGASYATDSTIDLASVCISLSCEQVDRNPLIWEVTAEYGVPDQQDNESEDQTENPDTQPPELRPPEVNITGGEQDIPVQQIVAYDTIQRDTEVEVQASNGEKFEPEPTIMQSRPVIRIKTVVKNLKLRQLLETYDNHVNESAWNDFPRETLLLKFSGAEPFYEDRKLYWTLSWELHYKQDTWALTLVNNGTYELIGGQPRLITDDLGNVGVRHLLDFNGVKSAGGQVYRLTFYVYPTVDLSALFPQHKFKIS